VTVEAGHGRERPALDLDDRDPQARRVEDEPLESLAAGRDDEQALRGAPGDERLLDRTPAGDELLALAEQVGGRRRPRRRTTGDNPWPSLPTTIARGPRRSAWAAVRGASASAAATRRPRMRRSDNAPGRSSTGQRRRCSTAPAEALIAAGVRGA
jgi:hypothetical protein